MRKRQFLALLLAVVVLVAGCAGELDDSVIREDAAVLLEAFAGNDYETCRAVLNDSVTDADLEGIFGVIAAELADLGEYEITAVGWNRNVSSGEDMTTVQYLVAGEGGKYYLSVSAVEGQEGLAGFQIAAAEEDAEPTTPAGPVHWVFTAVGAAVLGFVLWMTVDCIRRKMKLKWLWIPLILMGTMILTLTMKDGSFTFNFNVGLNLGLTSLSTFSAGGFQIRAYVPVVAIVYFLRRKEMTLTEEVAEEIVTEAE